MDVTPQVINEVEFHQKMRGYDPDEVDDFLERVAVAVEQFQERVRAAEQRAVAAERKLAELEERGPVTAPAAASPLNEVDETETIRRTLVLAQRTADAAVKEAEEEARQKLQAAQDQVQRLYSEAQDRARKLVIDAEAEARKTTEETRQRLVTEVQALEEARDALRADQGILERHMDEQRLRLRSSIGELQRLLDDPGRLRVAPPPDISDAKMPELREPPVTVLDDAGPFDQELDEEDGARPDAAIIDLGDQAREPAATNDELLRGATERPVTGGVTFTPPDEGDGDGDTEPTARDGGNVAVSAQDDEAWQRFANTDLDGPPTMALSTADAPSEDAYLSELRKAMLDDTSSGSLEPDEHRARPRFGRRR